MKKLLIILFSILISFNSYGEVELDFSSNTFCDQSPKAQLRGNLFYLPNQQKPYSGENLCVYLSNGQYYSRGDIKKGLRDGNWEYWHENGHKERKANYKDGKLIGETEYFYHETGQIKKEENYKDGKKNGKTTRWHENGQIESEENYKDGDLHGKLTGWYENGQKEAEINYKDDSGKMTSWYENGQMESEGNYKDKKRDGKWTYWHENGQIESEKYYKDGECISGDC